MSLAKAFELLDEQQLEVHKSLVQWKAFNTKDEALQFTKDNPMYYKPIEAKGKFFVWKSEVMQIYQDACKRVSEVFKLNVPLGIDPGIGLNWKDTH